MGQAPGPLCNVIFTKSVRASYMKPKSCLSVLLLMSHTEVLRYEIETEYQCCRAAGQNITVADLKRAQYTPRLPPTRWEEIAMRLITYILFLEALFGPRKESWRESTPCVANSWQWSRSRIWYFYK